MHPAFSVIFFTVLSGAGFGLLALAAMLGALGAQRLEPGFLLVAGGLGLGLATLGLLSSFFHLTHKLRAWRAFSQWRSSWLSREGVLACTTLLVAAAFFLSWIAVDWPHATRLLGAATVLLSLMTVYATAMIYRSLKTVPQWDDPLVPAVYLACALASGAAAWLMVGIPFGMAVRLDTVLTIVLVLLAAGLKLVYWGRQGKRHSRVNVADATGLHRHGKVRLLEPPHTGTNYLLGEMGYRVARKHARRLRVIAMVLMGGLPLLFLALDMVLTPWFGMVVLPLVLAGLLVERWLFFAEAQHVVTLYYGADKI